MRRAAAWGAYAGYLLLTLGTTLSGLHWLRVHRGVRGLRHDVAPQTPATIDAEAIARLTCAGPAVGAPPLTVRLARWHMRDVGAHRSAKLARRSAGLSAPP